jgi:hypothetical protein
VTNRKEGDKGKSEEFIVAEEGGEERRRVFAFFYFPSSLFQLQL